MVKVDFCCLIKISIIFKSVYFAEPSQKAWKRPGSAADAERRLAENRRVTGVVETPSGSDEKDRR